MTTSRPQLSDTAEFLTGKKPRGRHRPAARRWFPAFAVALITLIIGILLGFPPIAPGLLVGFGASTGPEFADMGTTCRPAICCAARAPIPLSSWRVADSSSNPRCSPIGDLDFNKLAVAKSRRSHLNHRIPGPPDAAAASASIWQVAIRAGRDGYHFSADDL